MLVAADEPKTVRSLLILQFQIVSDLTVIGDSAMFQSIIAKAIEGDLDPELFGELLSLERLSPAFGNERLGVRAPACLLPVKLPVSISPTNPPDTRAWIPFI